MCAGTLAQLCAHRHCPHLCGWHHIVSRLHGIGLCSSSHMMHL
eukprot:jgi/Botrbrau1/9609/Bobra.106_2s0030.1